MLICSQAMSQQELFKVEDNLSSSTNNFGRFVRNVGDLEGDGVDDFGVAALPYFSLSPIRTSEFSVFRGLNGERIGSTIQGAILPTAGSTDDLFGFAAGPAGDMNLDGFVDLAIGAPNGPNPWGYPSTPWSNGGAVHVYRFSGDFMLLRSWSHDPSFKDFGSSVLGLGDVTGDGYPDLAAGDPSGLVGGQTKGFVRVQSLNGPTGIEQLIPGSTVEEQFGTALAQAGDFDGDGCLDYFASAPFGGNLQEGVVRIVSGATGIPMHTVSSQVPQRRMGSTLANAGDLDGDGFADFFTTIRSTLGNSAAAYSSLAGGAFGGGIWAYPADGVSDFFSWPFAEEIASFPDLDGDGYRDLLVLDRSLSVNPNGFGVVLSGKFPVQLPHVNLPVTSVHGPTTIRSIAVLESTKGEKARAVLGDPEFAMFDGFLNVTVGRAIVAGYLRSGLERFGAGTPGCSGPQALTAFPRAALGTANFQIRCSQAPPSSLGLLLMTDRKQLPPSDLFGVGIDSCVTPIGATQVFTLDLLSDVSGNSSVLAPIPNQATLAGQQFNAQAIWAWQPSACTPSTYGLSSSLGLEITIQKP